MTNTTLIYDRTDSPDLTDGEVASLIREGDIVTMCHDYSRAKPFDAEVWEGDSGTLWAGLSCIRLDNKFNNQGRIIAAYRPLPAFPTEPWSMIVPRDEDAEGVFVLGRDGCWREVGALGEVEPDLLIHLLARGCHYVKWRES